MEAFIKNNSCTALASGQDGIALHSATTPLLAAWDEPNQFQGSDDQQWPSEPPFGNPQWLLDSVLAAVRGQTYPDLGALSDRLLASSPVRRAYARLENVRWRKPVLPPLRATTVIRRPGTAWFIAPDWNRPSGGVRKLYRSVDILNEAGARAAG